MCADTDYDNHGTGAVDQEAFDEAIRENLSPDGVVTVIAFLRTAMSGNQPSDPQALAAFREVEWLADTLTELLGVNDYNRRLNELGL